MIPAARHLGGELEASPFARLLGLVVEETMRDVAAASVPWRPLLANAQGFVHGGVAASLVTWTSTLVAVASDHGAAVSARPVSVSISYVAAARGEGLSATARVLSRGRDLVHVAVEVASDAGRLVATALAVLKTETAALPRSVGSRAPSPPPAAETAAPRPLVSPFSKALGIEVCSHGPAGARLSMRRSGNEGTDGVVDAGALLSLADTCAALACLPSLDERLSGSATLSMSAVFGDPLRSTVVADGRAVAGRGGVRSALIDVGGGALTACISYRFLAADSPA